MGMRMYLWEGRTRGGVLHKGEIEADTRDAGDRDPSSTAYRGHYDQDEAQGPYPPWLRRKGFGKRPCPLYQAIFDHDRRRLTISPVFGHSQ